MKTVFCCPACQSENWDIKDDYKYLRSEKCSSNLNDEYLKLRFLIFFDIWFPNCDEVCLQSMVCLNCGFMTYTPRPSETDVDAKYRFLQLKERNIGGQDPDKKNLKADHKRAEAIYRKLTSLTRKKCWEVLDFGGGNGKLLLPFLERGHSCDLVDYTYEPLPGIRKIGETLKDIPQNRKYDVIICSHVLEHVAEPARIVKELVELLADEGVIYAEVPMEIWEGIKIERDPVTHINFFTENSFKVVFLQQGLQIIESKQLVGTYSGWRLDVIGIVAGKNNGSTLIDSGIGVVETLRLLNPSISMHLRRLWRLKKIPPVRGIIKRLYSKF